MNAVCLDDAPGDGGNSAARAREEAPGFRSLGADLAGAWIGTLSHEGESESFALELEPGDDGKLGIWATIPVVHVIYGALGRVPLKFDGPDRGAKLWEFTTGDAVLASTGARLRICAVGGRGSPGPPRTSRLTATRRAPLQ